MQQMRQLHLELKILSDEEIFNEAVIRLEDKCLALGNHGLVELEVKPPCRDEINAYLKQPFLRPPVNKVQLRINDEKVRHLAKKECINHSIEWLIQTKVLVGLFRS